MGESRHRSLVKAISWRVVATSTTILLVLAFTGNLEVAFSVGSLEIVAKMLIYYVHERVWQTLSWGTLPLVLDRPD